MKSFQTLVAASLALLLVPPAAAQTHTSKVDVPHSLVEEPLEIARRALRRDDLEQAIRAYQTILDRHAFEVISVRETPKGADETDPVLPGDLYRGARSEVMGLITRLPEPGPGLYVELMEPRAAALLAEGLEERSEPLLRSAVIRYFLTPSGKSAFFALVDLLLERGHLGEARVFAQRLMHDLVAWPGGNPAAAAARLGVVWFARGRKGELEELRSRAGSDGLGGSVLVADESTTLADFLERLVAGCPEREDEETPSYVDVDVFRSEIWNIKIDQPDDSQFNLYYGWGRSRTTWFDYFPAVPKIHKGAIYYSDGLRVSAHSLFTGERLWPDVRSPQHRHEGRRNRNLFFEVTLDDDLLLAYLESEPYSRRRQAWVGFNPIEAVPARKLVAIDPATGRTRWSHLRFVAEESADTEFVSDFTVNTPPICVGDRVFAAGTLYHGVFRHWVCAFDRTTGDVVWRTFVAEGQMELNMFGNPIKECVPGHLTEQDGVLYYCTNIGVISAVDAATGDIVWISAYDQEPIPSTRSQRNKERYPGWMPSRPAVWKDRVFVAPTDSYHVYAADRRSGELTRVTAAFRSERNRNSYFLGIHEGLLLVAGRSVTAIDPDTLRERWRSAQLASSPPDGVVQGRPGVADGKVYFTTSIGDSREVYEVDLATGMMKNTVRLGSRRGGRGGVTGHVALGPEGAAVASAHRVHVFLDLEGLERQLERASRRSPDDPDVHLRLAEIRWRKDQRRAALADLEKALRLAKRLGRAGQADRRRAEQALYRLWRELAQRPELQISGVPVSVEDRYDRALAFADSDAEKVEVLVELLIAAAGTGREKTFIGTARRLIDDFPQQGVSIDRRLLEIVPDFLEERANVSAGLVAAVAAATRLEAKKRYAEAVGYYQEVIRRFPDGLVGDENAWDYAGDRIRRLVESVGSSVYAKLEREAAALVRRGRREGDLAALRRVLEHYPQSSVVEKAYLELTRRQLAADAYREALRDIQRYMSRFGRVTAPVLVEYVRCLDRLGSYDSARQLLLILSEDFGREMVQDGERRFQARAWAENMLSRPEYEGLGEGDVPDPAVPSPVPDWTWAPEKTRDAVRLVQPLGRAPDAARDLVIFHQAGSLVALDAATGTESWRKAVHGAPWLAIWRDGRLLLDVDGDAVALDPATGREVWRAHAERRRLLDMGVGQGKAYILSRPVEDPGTLVLEARDIVTGNAVQTLSLTGYRDPAVTVGDRYVLVTGKDKSVVMDALTGSTLPHGIWRYRTYHMRPILNDEGHVLRSTGPLGGNLTSNEDLRIQSVDPEQRNRLVWEYRLGSGRFDQVRVDGRHLVFRVQERRRLHAGQPLRSFWRIVALDARKGALLADVKLDDDEVPHDAVISDHRLFIRYRTFGQRPRSGSHAVRVIDIRNGTRIWDTTRFYGARPRLEMLPAKDHLLLRRSDTSSLRRSRAAPAGALYFIDLDNGTTVHEIEIEQTSVVHENPNFGVYGDRLVIAAGHVIEAYAP